LAGSTSANPVLANGNLDVTGGAGYWGRKISTIGMTTGKWYSEVTVNSVGNNSLAFGVTNSVPTTDANNQNGEVAGYSIFIVAYYSAVAAYNRLYNSGYTTLGGGCSVGDVYGLAFDADVAKLYFYKNGSVLGSASGYTFTTNGQPFFFQILAGVAAATGGASTNFGQRPFAYTAPSGFQALCTQNLSTPAIGATSNTLAGQFFNPVLYTGNGTTQSVTGVGFQPDFTWIKSRSGIINNSLYDAVRGAGKVLFSNGTETEYTVNDLTSFNLDGFSVSTVGGTRNETNQNSQLYVGWNWKAGNNSGSLNYNGTIRSQVSVNPTSGFSIVTYTGTGVDNATIGHGLGIAPSMIIAKSRSVVGAWPVWFNAPGFGASDYLAFNATDAKGTAVTLWGGSNASVPTSTVFKVGTGTSANGNGTTYVAYCWAEIPGFSKFGSYTGNGNADGPFIYCGFKPAFFMIKSLAAAGSHWVIYDNKRNTYNQVNLQLAANIVDAESNQSRPVDFLSNGVKIKFSTYLNVSADTYIFVAFAESPFKYSLAR
jgi:hypothetical protein